MRNAEQVTTKQVTSDRNATGMIVFRILKATVVNPTSVERTLISTEGNKFRYIMFIIIESGMALFAVQWVRIVLEFIPVLTHFLKAAEDIDIVIYQMLDVIIIKSVHFYFFRFADDIYLTRESHQR